MHGVRTWVSAGLAAAAVVVLVVGCTVSVMTPIPAGFPLNACPTTGEGAVTAMDGFELLQPGSIAFAYDQWHNETPDSHLCGAASVKGADSVIRRSDLESGLLPWAAAFKRRAPLLAAEASMPEARLFVVEGAGERLVESIEAQTGPQWGALGNAFEGVVPIPLGRYRMDIVSVTGEVVATGAFEIVD